jgi:Putative cyclase
MPELIDLSHTIHDGLVTYPGLPAPAITDHLSRQASRGHYAGGVEFLVGHIEMVANTGTYLDAPFHRYPDGADLAALRLTQLAGLPGTLRAFALRDSVQPRTWHGPLAPLPTGHGEAGAGQGCPPALLRRRLNSSSLVLHALTVKGRTPRTGGSTGSAVKPNRWVPAPRRVDGR